MTEKEWIKNGYSMGVIEPEAECISSFNDIYQRWFLLKTRRIKPESVDRIECTFKRYFLYDDILAKKLNCIDDNYIIDWLTEKILALQSMSYKEFGRLYQIMYGVMNYAHDIGVIGSHLCDWGKIRRQMPENCIHKKASKDIAIPINDVNVIFKSVLQYDIYSLKRSACLCLCLNFFLGLRVGELAALDWTDVDFNNKCVYVRKTEVKFFERDEFGTVLKGTMSYKVQEGVKTAHSDRIVPLCDEALYILCLLKNYHDSMQFEDNRLAYDGSQTILTRSLDRTFKKLCSLNDLPSYNTHKIRKTYASYLQSCGVPLPTISDLLGHADSSTTAKYYLKSSVANDSLNILLNKSFHNFVDITKKDVLSS